MVVAVVCGLAISAVAAWHLRTQFSEAAVEAPRLEEVTNADISADAAKLAGLLATSTVKQYNIKVDGVQAAVVSFDALEVSGKPPVVVKWESHVNQPIFRSDISAKEDRLLIEALMKHLPKDATIIAMPELSRRLQPFFAGTKLPMSRVPPTPATGIPANWLDEKIARFVHPEIPGEPTKDTRQLWENFQNAMISEDIYGAARLRVLSANKESFIVLHLRDIFDLGSEQGERLLVGIKDFEGGSHAHDITRKVRDWRSANGYVAHAVMKLPNGRLRAYFLSNAKDKSTTIGQLLPFDGARVGLVPGTKLVFQTGGYWIYKLLPI